MKAFKIKKRSHKQAVFIIGPPVTSFPKPKLPLFFFAKVHRPALFKPQPTWVVQQEERPEAVLAHPLPVSAGLQEMVEKSANQEFELLLPATAS